MTYDHWDVDDPDAERTQVLPPVADTPEPEPERTKELPTVAPAPTPVPVSEPVRRPVEVPPASGASRPVDPRGTEAWAYQMARQNNKGTTDVGLLLLRLLSLPLLLHGITHVITYPAFVETLAGTALGAQFPPDTLAVALIAGQLTLPLFLAVGALTRLCAALQSAMMALVWMFGPLVTTGVFDPQTGALAGEAALAYAALALPLVFTGAGRISIDHGLTSGRRERVATRRIEKATRV